MPTPRNIQTATIARAIESVGINLMALCLTLFADSVRAAGGGSVIDVGCGPGNVAPSTSATTPSSTPRVTAGTP